MQPDPTIIKTFWASVDRRSETECWQWTGARHIAGYGFLPLANAAGWVIAHRFSYELHYGPIADGSTVLHRCDLLSCVNPEHLYSQSRTTVPPVPRRRRPPRPSRERSYANANAKLTAAQVEEIIDELRRPHHRNQRAIAEAFDISQAQVSRIANGQSWKYLHND